MKIENKRNGGSNERTAPDYKTFLEAKSQAGAKHGFKPLWMPDFLFDFQKALAEWSILKGRSAIFADCGLGKTPIQLVWADNVIRKTNKPVLILLPLAVAHQHMAEASKFGIEASRPGPGQVNSGINLINYERLNHYNPDDYSGCVCDESSILKSFDGVRRAEITEFMRKIPYRLLCTATAAPNDYIELGTSSEALGELGYTDMLQQFFKNDSHSVAPRMSLGTDKESGRMLHDRGKWRFKGHAETPFWKWVCSWARACRRPSDLGFDDGKFILPPLVEAEHMVEVETLPNGMLFPLPAVGLKEQRDERNRSINERCDKVTSLVHSTEKPALVWCHLNLEGDRLERSIKGAMQVRGDDAEEKKEEALMAFANGEIRVLITKPKIGAYGLNFQKCSHVTFFPSHSFEQYYQGVRRCWRFGQANPVRVDIITTEGEQKVLANLQRKAQAADRMFSGLVSHMNEATKIDKGEKTMTKEKVPTWL